MEKLTIVLDGCHNGDSVLKFMDGVSSSSSYSNDVSGVGKRLWTVFGAGTEKVENIAQMLDYVLTKSDKVILIQAEHFKAMSTSCTAVFVRVSACVWTD